jgi:tetratricopeptide (TPR) repeat protein
VNNLAWLCARCDERLDEALELSSRAIEEMPQNFAYLDTAAEANFRKGNPAKAVELEEFALTFRPKDTFMIEQLERFRKGN